MNILTGTIIIAVGFCLGATSAYFIIKLALKQQDHRKKLEEILCHDPFFGSRELVFLQYEISLIKYAMNTNSFLNVTSSTAGIIIEYVENSERTTYVGPETIQSPKEFETLLKRLNFPIPKRKQQN